MRDGAKSRLGRPRYRPVQAALGLVALGDGPDVARLLDACREMSRAEFAAGALGLPDLVLFADLDAATLRRRKADDTTRPRSRHEMHLRIAPALKRWYVAMAVLDPARRIRLADRWSPSGIVAARSARRTLRRGPVRSLHRRAGMTTIAAMRPNGSESFIEQHQRVAECSSTPRSPGHPRRPSGVAEAQCRGGPRGRDCGRLSRLYRRSL